jgi:hypothetical protein
LPNNVADYATWIVVALALAIQPWLGAAAAVALLVGLMWWGKRG